MPCNDFPQRKILLRCVRNAGGNDCNVIQVYYVSNQLFLYLPPIKQHKSRQISWIILDFTYSLKNAFVLYWNWMRWKHYTKLRSLKRMRRQDRFGFETKFSLRHTSSPDSDKWPYRIQRSLVVFRKFFPWIRRRNFAVLHSICRNPARKGLTH